MKSTAELKNLAWRRLWSERWFGRLLGGSLLLCVCGNAVCSLVGGALDALNVQDWEDYGRAVAGNRVTCTTPVPNLTPDYALLATSATLFQWFFLAIMSGIAAYGCAVILRRCLANEEQGWLKAAFGGFGMPFGMFWLFFRRALIGFGWVLLPALLLAAAAVAGAPLLARLALPDPVALAIVAGAAAVGVALLVVCACVPFYRYRYLWLVKAGHPEWGAGACLGACRALMRGNMMKAVRLDCSYWRPIALALLLAAACVGSALAAAAGVMPAATGLAGIVSFCAFATVTVVTGPYIAAGQAFLYRELEQGTAAPQADGGAALDP